ncbi:hypothetical protein MYMAC_004427 [Corallococcus macrosporus DSM 14697]|uniref:Uncharacterized protein n=1 Tax=Corallococcus macrosporus DSM 14697 TaxID=1189310 RepID=A0A250K0B1_9BACT|nr:hypothetical protein MYMAC_004427 [Corallococcus macrosporus DSM 14697]
MRRCNEVLHSLTGHVGRTQSGRVDSATERSFVEMIVAVAGSYGWLATLKLSFDNVQREGS